MRSFFFIKGFQRSKRETPKFADRDAYEARLMAARFTMRPAIDPLGFFETWPIARENQLSKPGIRHSDFSQRREG